MKNSTLELTDKEKKFIDDFKKVAKTCPKSLWIFVGDGNLHIVKKGKDGKIMQKRDLTIDGNYVVASIHDIQADGGGF